MIASTRTDAPGYPLPPWYLECVSRFTMSVGNRKNYLLELCTEAAVDLVVSIESGSLKRVVLPGLLSTIEGSSPTTLQLALLAALENRAVRKMEHVVACNT